jgi:hypothetical protein
MAPSNGRGIAPELSGDLPSTNAPTSGGIVEPRAGPARALWARGHGRRQSSTFHAAGRLMRWTDEASTRTERRSFAHRAPWLTQRAPRMGSSLLLGGRPSLIPAPPLLGERAPIVLRARVGVTACAIPVALRADRPPRARRNGLGRPGERPSCGEVSGGPRWPPTRPSGRYKFARAGPTRNKRVRAVDNYAANAEGDRHKRQFATGMDGGRSPDRTGLHPKFPANRERTGSLAESSLRGIFVWPSWPAEFSGLQQNSLRRGREFFGWREAFPPNG